MNISIIGTGYVGLVTGTCLADFGLSVTCVDQDETKISLLNKESKVIFIAVGTPSNDDGSANLVQIEEVAKQIALFINNYKVIVIKSTVPVGTTRKIEEIINENQPDFVIPAEAGIYPSGHCEGVKRPKQSHPSPSRGESRVRVKYPFDLVSNPEFLREGSAVYDFTHPDKIECFDPLAMENSRKVLPTLTYCQDEYETAEHCDTLVIAIDWNQFRNLDLTKLKKLLKSPILLDLRNLYEPAQVKELGFHL